MNAVFLRKMAFFLIQQCVKFAAQWNEYMTVDDNAPDSSRNQVAALAKARWTAVHVSGWRRDMMILLRGYCC